MDRADRSNDRVALVGDAEQDVLRLFAEYNRGTNRETREQRNVTRLGVVELAYPVVQTTRTLVLGIRNLKVSSRVNRTEASAKQSTQYASKQGLYLLAHGVNRSRLVPLCNCKNASNEITMSGCSSEEELRWSGLLG